MIIRILFVFLFAFSDIYGAKFRFDYAFNRQAEGWLKLHRVPATWSDARLLCHAEGAVLASPLTHQLQKAIEDYVLHAGSVDTIFTGVHTTFTKAAYASIEGVPLSRLPINWAPGEPDNFENSESCLAMLVSNNSTMKDVKCTDVYSFVCYKKRTQSLVVTGCGTHDIEYNHDKRTGSCYKFHRRGLTWKQAHMTCMAEGGHLVIMSSDQEALIVKELYAKHPDNLIFSKNPQFASIGIYNSADGGSWMTIHGETPTEAGYDKWYPGQPENATQPMGEFCGVTDRGSARLLDAPCNWEVPFICEKPAVSLEDPDDIIF